MLRVDARAWEVKLAIFIKGAVLENQRHHDLIGSIHFAIAIDVHAHRQQALGKNQFGVDQGISAGQSAEGGVDAGAAQQMVMEPEGCCLLGVGIAVNGLIISRTGL